MKARHLVLVTAAGALLLTACGSSDDDTSDAAPGASASSGGSAALEAAAERVKAASVEPTSVGVTEPLSKKPDAGKRVTYLTCGVGVCKQIDDELKVASKALGWTVTSIAAGTTPEEIVAAWNRALSASPKPDAILTSGVPVSLFQEPLKRAKAANIAVVDWASANPPGTDGILFDINPAEDNQTRGKLMADYVATSSGGKAQTLFLNVPDFKTLVVEQEAYEAQMAEVCGGACKTETLAFAATDIGTKVPSAVVSHLQSNPDIDYVVPAWDDLGLGVAEALKAAGLDSKVKIVSQSGNTVAATNIANGVVNVATIPQGVGQMAFKALDVLARHWNGDSLDADKANLLPIWIQTKDTIGDPKNVWKGPKGYEDQFKALWKVS